MNKYLGILVWVFFAAASLEAHASNPASVMLDAQGYITSVKQQGNRNSCTVFSSVAAIEAEYKIRYGLTLDLSEQYLINMINEDRPADWIGGVPDEKLRIAAFYGLPTASEWPYVGSVADVTAQQRVAFPNGPSDAASFGALLWSNLFDRDITNYSHEIYPSIAASEGARYAPGTIVVVPNPSSAESFETVLAQKHPIVFMTATGQWKQQASGVFGYNASGDKTIDHAILMVGYDHAKQLFRIKNSWGTSWANAGFADFTYELVLKTVQEAEYIQSIRPPTAGVLGGGVWRGFWRAEFDRKPGIAVIRHSYGQAGTGALLEGLKISGDFYPDKGWGQDFTLPTVLSADSTSVVIGDAHAKPWIRLERKEGQNFAVATNLVQGGTDTWWKCNPANSGSYTPNTKPADYPATLEDPNVLPACK